jgi:antitoxin (DNA-binding transcriptional repressor) of toxin-antitoxin stability system
MIETHSEPFVRENDDMAVLHITEAELARDIHGVLEKIRQGAEIIVEHEHKPVARMTSVRGPGRLLSECIAIAKQRERERGYAITLDPDFANDVEEIVRDRQPWNPPSWD